MNLTILIGIFIIFIIVFFIALSLCKITSNSDKVIEDIFEKYIREKNKKEIKSRYCPYCDECISFGNTPNGICPKCGAIEDFNGDWIKLT